MINPEKENGPVVIESEKENGPVSKLGSSSGTVCGDETRGTLDHLLQVAGQSLVLGQGGERQSDR